MKKSRYLLLDNRIVARRSNAALRVGEPAKHSANPLFLDDRPWEPRYDNGYPNVILDPEDGLYKCWYSPFIIDAASEMTPRSAWKRGTYLPRWREIRERLPRGRPSRRMGMCYAVSRDGLKWRKPNLGLTSFGGNRRNNILAVGLHGAGVFFDAREPNPKRRYKVFFRDNRLGRHHMAVGFSADGLSWRYRACAGIAARGDTHNNAFWAPTLGKYVGITRQCRPSKSVGLLRQVARTISDDFVHWSKARVIFEGLDDDLQIYSMPVCFHAGIYIGLATIFQISTDRAWVELAWSADTVRWHRVEPGRPLIPCGRGGSYDWGCVYASNPIFFEDRVDVYYCNSDGTHTDWRAGGLCLASLGADGFAGYAPADRRKEAVIVTKPVRLTPGLRLTADVDRGGSVMVAARGAGSKVLARSRPIRRTGADVPVRWHNKSDPSTAGRLLRLEFHLKKAKLYSFSLTQENASHD